MSARIEAARQAIAKGSYAMSPTDLPYADSAVRALAAADAVMFDEAAIERGARMMQAIAQPKRAWGDCGPVGKESWRESVRAVIAALKGDEA